MSIPTLSTVKLFCKKYPAFKEGGLRYQIFYAKENGLDEAGAIVRIGRKVMIDEEKFFNWVCGGKKELARNLL